MSGSDNERDTTALGEESLGLVPTAELLPEREALGTLLFEMTPQGVVCHDANGVIFANPAAQHLLGLSSAQLQGHLTVDPSWRFVHEGGSEFPWDEQPGMVALRTAREIRDVVGVVDPEGSTFRWLNVTAKPLFRPGESAAFRSLVFLDDITERKRTEEELCASRAELRSLFDVLPVGVAILDEHQAVKTFNPALGAILGLTSDGLREGAYRQRRYLRLDGTPMPPEEFPSVRARREQRTIRAVPIGVVKEDGSTVWTEVSAAPLSLPKISCVTVTTDVTERMREEELLQKSEAKLRAVLDAAPFPVAIVDVEDDKIDFWSRSALTLFGHSAPTAAKWYEIAYPDQDYRQAVVARWKPFLEQAKASGKTVNTGEYRVACHDGSERICELHAGFIADSLVVTFDDITERKQVAEAQRKVEETYRMLFDSINDALLVSELDDHGVLGRFVLVNDVACRRLGYSREELLSKTPADINSESSKPSIGAKMRKLLEQERAIVETEHVTKDGRIIPAEISTNVATLGNKTVFCSVVRDITERKMLENAVQSERKFIASVLDTVPVGVLTLDAAGLVTSANQRAVSILGLRKDDPLGMTYDAPVWRILALDGTPFPEDRLPFSVVMATGRPVFGVKHAIHWPDGKRVVLSINAAPTFDEQGRVAGMTASIEDTTELERGEVERRRSAERFSAAFGVSPYAKAIMRLADDVILDVNEAFAVTTGHSRDEAVGNTSAGLGLWVDSEERSRVVKELGVDRKVVEREVELRRKNGEIRVVQFSAVLMSAANEVHILMNLHDITEHNRMQTALHESQQRLQCILDNASLLVYVKDLEGRLTLVNRALETLFGMPREQLLGKTSHELMSIEDADAHRANDLAAMAAGKPVVAEERNEEADGPHTYLSTKFSLFDLAGKMTGVCGISIDVTERRQAEESYGTLFREMLDGFALHEMIYDAEGRPVDYRFLAVNPAFERMTGLKADTIQGRTVLEVMPATERHWIEAYGRVVLSGEPLRFESYAAALKKHFEVKAFRPAPRQFVCIFIDVTERKTSEAEKSILEDQLHQAQKMEAVGCLAGGVAHDFNNMLGAILGHVEMAMEDVDSTQALYADLQEIQTAARRSADLTRQLLAFARKQTVAPKVLELNQTVEGMLKMLHRLIGEDIELTWRPDADLWSVKLDPSQIDQILANLCVNARDAIADVGKITIETENSRFDQDYCANHVGYVVGDYVQLAVSDNGCGMDKATLARLFEPFFTTKESGKGTGLGLATVYGIVKQNSGFINVYSEPGHGTTFKIYLPRHVGDAGAAVERAARPAARGNETILVVEDETSILNMTKRILERLGYSVLTARTPGEAIGLASEYLSEIHLLVTDVVMPEMNGRGLAKQLQALFPRLKCLFMSGYTADVIAHHGVLDEGVNFVQKPFSREELAAKVREVLDGGNVAGAVIGSPDTALLGG